MPEFRPSSMRLLWHGAVVLCILSLSHVSIHAGAAYGSINNFDAVNDTGVPCHGFQIELDDIRSTDITSTFDWNHYGVPKIYEDNSDPLHPKVFVRYESAMTNGGWAAFTAVPTSPIAPTQGHQFTDPSINFGGEHFGVGYRGNPSTIKYNWLIDNGIGMLILGPTVNISTPAFTYVPAAGGVPAQVQAAIVPPPPPAPPVLEFGPASWVKEIRTSSHNENAVQLRDLISKEPDYPDIKDWRNGEPDEVEVEWQILQTDYNAANGGANGELKGAPENLPHGDEVITRRYEFYKYVGPIDPETGEALGATVAADGVHGTGTNSDTVVVGDFLGAQMSAFDVHSPVGLIDHLPDGEINVPYGDRTVIIAGDSSFVTTTSGLLPNGLVFDPATGLMSGTPTVSGVFVFGVQVTSTNNPPLKKKYAFTVADAGVVLSPHGAVDTSVMPANGGSASGTGVYTNGAIVTVMAAPNPGFGFVSWTDNGISVSQSASYQFIQHVNRSLVANFAPMPTLQVTMATGHNLVIRWATNCSGFNLLENYTLGSTNWHDSTNAIGVLSTNYQASVSATDGSRFFQLQHP